MHVNVNTQPSCDRQRFNGEPIMVVENGLIHPGRRMGPVYMLPQKIPPRRRGVAEVHPWGVVVGSEGNLAAELNDAGCRGLSDKAKLAITYGTINGRVAARSSH